MNHFTCWSCDVNGWIRRNTRSGSWNFYTALTSPLTTHRAVLNLKSALNLTSSYYPQDGTVSRAKQRRVLDWWPSLKETDKDRSLAHKATVSISPRISPGRRLSLNKSSHANEGPERGSGCASFRTCIAVRSNAFLQTLMKLFLKNLISAETDAIGVDSWWEHVSSLKSYTFESLNF